MENNKTNLLEKRIEKLQEQSERGRRFLEKTKYFVEIEIEGSPLNGEDKMVKNHVKKKVMTLGEIVEDSKFLEKPFWSHPSDLSEKEIKEFPFEEKRWGIYKSIQIVSLSLDNFSKEEN